MLTQTRRWLAPRQGLACEMNRIPCDLNSTRIRVIELPERLHCCRLLHVSNICQHIDLAIRNGVDVEKGGALIYTHLGDPAGDDSHHLFSVVKPIDIGLEARITG